MHRALIVDSRGSPQGWASPRKALKYYVKGDVLWELGEPVASFHSIGIHRQHLISPSCIIGIRGDSSGHFKESHYMNGRVSRRMLFARDRWTCAYCGHAFPEDQLTKEHILPQSRQGANIWMNLITACSSCNRKKANRTPEEAGMPLLFLPYIPSKWEGLILQNRKILPQQKEFLLSKLPKHSRLFS